MNRLGLALAAAAVLAAAPHAALAQRAGASPAPAAAGAKAGAPPSAKQTADQRARGMKEAPAVVAGSTIAKTCQVADALFRGQADDPAAPGKKSSVYEVACQNGPGYIVIAKPSQPQPQVLNCIIAAGGNAKCELPKNTDFKAALAPAVQASGRQCAISDVRYVGSAAAEGVDYYELACAAPQLGFIIGVSSTGAAPVLNDCLSALGTSQECKLVTKAQILQNFAPLVAKSGKTCQLSDIRSIGRSKSSNEEFIEVACGTQPGFILVTDPTGGFKSAVDCAKATGFAGGCKMTDVTVAQTQEIGAYTKLAAKAGFPCNVKQYRFIGMDAQNREVVELACSDRPDGALAALAETGKSLVYDCVRGGGISASTCKLTDPAVVFPKYTEALAAKGRSTCKVSNAVFLARTTDSADFIETACADGLPGYVMSFADGSNTVKDLLNCKQAASAGVACKLPGNAGK